MSTKTDKKGAKYYFEGLDELEIFSKKRNHPTEKEYEVEIKELFVVTKL